MAAKKMAKNSAKNHRSFHDELVLNRFILSYLGLSDFAALQKILSDERLIGINQEGQTYFFEALSQAGLSAVIDEDSLRRYDGNIVRHWQKVTKERNKKSGHVLQMKYFQYLSLLFTEIYLDGYFHQRKQMLLGLNALLNEHQELGFFPYDEDDLNKIAFWNATGSGKTLLMHVNILQYQDYCTDKIDQIIVLTPNEGLSHQHNQELMQSGFFPLIFGKNQGNMLKEPNEVLIIDINKLADKTGEKTVAVESFAGRNLVLVDEGHRGASGDSWLRLRESLISAGFSFEYSATFGQAVAKSKTLAQEIEAWQKNQAGSLFGKKSLKGLSDDDLARLTPDALTLQEEIKPRALREVYAKAVLFDYSYKYFYADGYGKESQILNLHDEDYERHSNSYLIACLLSFYQQCYLYERHKKALSPFLLEKPLWIFVGNTVSHEDSDILVIVQFLAYFLGQPEVVKRHLHSLLSDTAELTDPHGNNIFLGQFIPLMHYLGKEADLYQDILQKVFNTAIDGRLQLTRLKNADGEFALSVGSGEAFGVINIGDTKKFANLLEQEKTIDVLDNDFTASLFKEINQPDSPISLLIGAKKFTEGWSSWRVSTMGLLNIGKNEGSQIIQLFGRGVRLKGQNFSLKRTQESERPKDVFLEKLETLNIFGIRAGYMETFKNYLKTEGITPKDEMLTLDFRVRSNLPEKRLKTLQLKNGYKDNQSMGFKRQEKGFSFFLLPEKYRGKIKPIVVELDLYPKIEVQRSKEKIMSLDKRQQHRLDTVLFSLFDWEEIYLALWEEKWLRSWWNLRLEKEHIQSFARKNDWYKLYCPPDFLTINSFSDIKKQQEILIDLLSLYMKRFYQTLKAAYEGQFYEAVWVDKDNPSLQNSYQFTIENTDEGRGYYDKLMALKVIIEKGTLKEALNWQAASITAICFEPHLYYPIMTLANKEDLPLTMKPMDMNEMSEIRFVQDLQAAANSGKLKSWIGDKSLYLLRNAANKNKGLGFALAGNFYPDFLLWLTDGASDKQWLSFIDPKGILHMGINHPKFGLAEEVKKLQKDNAIDMNLNAFILSITKKEELPHQYDEEAYRKKNILFMQEQDYLQILFAKMLETEA